MKTPQIIEKDGGGGMGVARVISEHRGLYKVKDEDKEYLARITGKQMFEAKRREDYPAVGDFVMIMPTSDDQAVIKSVLPRQTVIKRRQGDKAQVIAANIDIAFVVESTDRDYNLNRFERYFAIARDGGVEPAIILNKIDLLSDADLNEKIKELKKRFPDIDVILTSVESEKGLNELQKYIIGGKTYCFLGSSGVGKSSLINKLLGKNMIKTKEVSSYSDRGKHATTGRQMYFLQNGGIVIDNPGMREVGLSDAGQGVGEFFGEITEFAQKCKYTDCTHTHEPGCAVVAAVNSGELDQAQYANYINLKKETKHYEMTEAERREKDRQFGKFIKRTKKELGL